MDEGNAPATLPRPGDTIAGKYAIVRVIGEGGMGVVYEAHHLRLRKRVALKMLLPHMMATSSDTVARFEREARAAGQLKDRHVTKVLDVDATSEGIPYLVMEYLEGHDLEAELNARGPLPVGEAVGYVLQVCSAMTEAHDAGIVHRDLKPSNLFLCPDRDGWIVKVLDFGISKMVDEGEARLTNTQASVGTPLYMSPEQVRSARNVDSRTDIWALGVILYELLAGRTPFEGSTTAAAAAIVADPTPPLTEYRDDLPEELMEVIYHALSKDPAKRYSTVTELAQALHPFSGPIHPSVTPPPPSTSSLTPEPHSRPVTPAPTSSPFHPSHPSHSSRLSYPRAKESSATVAAAESSISSAPAPSASPTPAVIASVHPAAPSRKSAVALAGAAVLLVAGAGLFAAQRRGAEPSTDRAARSPASIVAGAGPIAASSVPPLAPAPSQPPAPPPAPAPAQPPPSAIAASLSPATPTRTSARPPVTPAPHAAPAGAPPRSGPSPTPPAASPAPGVKGQANPLFL